jgi:tetratricopeptide (TPR) repeat protein
MVDLEKIPVLRIKRRLGRFFKRFKFWIFLIAFLLVLSLLSKPLAILWDIVKSIAGILKPVVDNPVGRVVVVTLVLAGIAWVVWWRFSARLRRLIGYHALDRFLDGVNHMVMDRHRNAVRCFEAVLRRAKVVDLETAVPAYPDLLDAARIKLAECHRILGDLDASLRWLEAVRAKGLPDDLRRIHREIRALVYDAHPGMREEVRRGQVESAAKDDGKNARLLRVLRDHAEGKEDLGGAVRAQQRLVRATPRPERPEARRELAALHYRRGRKAEEEGDLETAEREYRTAAKVQAFDLPWLRLGDMALARADVAGALDAWAKAPPLPALDRIRGLLSDGRLEGSSDRAVLIQRFPFGETLLVLAEHFLEKGDRRRARNALVKLEDLGMAGPAVDRLAARIAREEGDGEEAARREVAAVRSFLTDGRL